MRALAIAAAACILPARAAAKSPDARAYAETAHGDPTRSVPTVGGTRPGSCTTCHGQRGSGRNARPPPAGNDLCLECHQRSAVGSFQGDAEWASSAHATSPSMLWPGPPARPRPDAGKCVNCHDPHGTKDRAGIVPAMLRVRGDNLCLACHGGDPAPDVRTAFLRPYRHPLTAEIPGGASAAARGLIGGAYAPASGNVVPNAGSAPGAPGAGTCTGCHNPHAAQPPDASGSAIGPRPLAGVARVRVTNGDPGTPPGYVALAADDRSPVQEYEVCFRCHSGFAQRPPQGADLALSLNSQNPSFHPVEDRGRNQGIDRRAFALGWAADRTVTCSDCHSADANGARGPHGSSYPHLLRKRNPAATGGVQRMQDGDLCFECHAFATYADPSGGPALAYSRFSVHVSHAANGATCSACHDAHGSATQPALLAQRPSALSSFKATADGGSCTTTCHRRTPATTSYRVTYAR